MKKFTTVFLSICLSTILACALSSCGGTATSHVQSEDYKPVVSSYAYDQLTDKEQALYSRMKEALLSFAPALEEELEEYTREQINKVVKFVMIDSPEIFWANEGGTVYTSELDGVKTITKYEFKYILSESQKDEMQGQINTEVKSFLDGVASGLSEYERTLAVYEHLIQTTEYDMAVKNKIAGGISDDDTKASQAITSVFISKKTVCSGYSKATQYLLNKLGIFCIYVSGGARGQGDNHAWNLLQIEGEYYLLDTTWGNPVSTDPAQGKRMTYNYFCLTTDEFNKSHTPNDDISLPKCTATKYNYFAYNNLLLNEYDMVRIEEIMRDAAENNEEEVSIKFSGKGVAEQAEDALFGSEKDIFKILASAVSNGSSLDETRTSHSFDADTNVMCIGLSYK